MPEPSEDIDGTAHTSELDLRSLIEAQVAARRRDKRPARATDPSAGSDLAAQSGSHAALAAPHSGSHSGSHALSAGLPDARPVSLPAGETHRHHKSLHRRGPSVLRSVVRIAVVVILVLLLRLFVLASFYIPSGSMEPTLHGCDGCNDDMVVVDKLSYRFGKVSRDDVVVFDRPPNVPAEDKELIKRVIGLPGDVVSAHGGRVYVGDKALVEPYVNASCHGTTDFGPVTVPAGRYFMMGDNRCISLDSRMFGTVPKSSIVGRAFAIVWPVKRLSWL
ncbi:MAG TPA: signal peptidase I [Jatrophihabitans sp.]